MIFSVAKSDYGFLLNTYELRNLQNPGIKYTIFKSKN